MGSWFDDFMVIKILDGDSDPDEECCEDPSDSEELLEELRTELSTLQDELSIIELDEPGGILSDTHMRWDARRELLENQIATVEADISELEDV